MQGILPPSVSGDHHPHIMADPAPDALAVSAPSSRRASTSARPAAWACELPDKGGSTEAYKIIQQIYIYIYMYIYIYIYVYMYVYM